MDTNMQLRQENELLKTRVNFLDLKMKYLYDTVMQLQYQKTVQPQPQPLMALPVIPDMAEVVGEVVEAEGKKGKKEKKPHKPHARSDYFNFFDKSKMNDLLENVPFEIPEDVKTCTKNNNPSAARVKGYIWSRVAPEFKKSTFLEWASLDNDEKVCEPSADAKAKKASRKRAKPEEEEEEEEAPGEAPREEKKVQSKKKVKVVKEESDDDVSIVSDCIDEIDEDDIEEMIMEDNEDEF